MRAVSWIHLSDWHQKGRDFDRFVVRDKLMDDVAKRMQIDPNLRKVDFLIFSGDVTYHGTAEEYDTAVEQLFNPLLQAADLGEAGRGRLFVVPGNHDLNRDFLDVLPADLSKTLDRSEAVNDWLTDERKRGALLGPTAAYSRFVSEYLGSHQTFAEHDPGYWYASRLEAAGMHISILCFNSTWFSARNKDTQGQIQDYGYLILGEPQVHGALARANDADIRIAVMHHPFEWLREFDRNRVEERVSKECHFVLCGHQHVPRVRVERGTGGDYVSIPAGASYDRRVPIQPRYANSYNHVRLDFESGWGTVYLRRLSDRRTEWIADTDVAEEGRYQFRLPKSLGERHGTKESGIAQLPIELTQEVIESSPFAQFEKDLREWLKACSHQFETHHDRGGHSFTFVTEEPITGGYDRILVYGVEGEAKAADVFRLQEAVSQYQTHRGWLVSMRRITAAARQTASRDPQLRCYTFDELIDQKANFDKYFSWLEEEVKRRSIEKYYVDLSCVKDDLDPETGENLGTSRYERIEDYISLWLDDSIAEHISILGEFGTGKTWFCLHFAYNAMRAYKAAKEAGRQRPRLPLIIQLRDFSKAMDIETLFSDLFFRRFEIGLPGYSAYEQLNRMGKLLLIFDGFDEMADRTNRQKQIDNFWQLARAVGPGSKAILTCRTEHFEFAKAAAKTFRGEGIPTTIPHHKTLLEPPRFEIIYLEKLTPQKIKRLIVKREGVEKGTKLADRILANPALTDLAERAGSVELIIAALPSLRGNGQIDLARVLLHATREMLLKNIREKRSFTSMADKVHFLCELAWQMLSTGELKINFADFPDRLRQYRPELKDREIDHWRYDLGAQTLLVSDGEGNYSFSHKSLPEFFVSYKFAGELGLFSPDSEWIKAYFGQKQESQESFARQWHDFFVCPNKPEVCDLPSVERDGAIHCSREAGTCMTYFLQESLDSLVKTFGYGVLIPEVLAYLTAMAEKTDPLWRVINGTAGKSFSDVAYMGGNAATLLNRLKESFGGRNLRKVVIAGADLNGADLAGTNLQQAILLGADLTGAILDNVDLREADLNAVVIQELTSIRSMSWSKEDPTLAVATSDDKLLLWSNSRQNTRRVILASRKLKCLTWDSTGRKLYAACDGGISLFRLDSGEETTFIKLEGHIAEIALDRRDNKMAVRRSLAPKRSNRFLPNSTVKQALLLDVHTKKASELVSVTGIFNHPSVLRFSPDADLLFVGRYSGRMQVYDLRGKKKTARQVFEKSSVSALAIGARGLLVCGSRRGGIVFCDEKLVARDIGLPKTYQGGISQIEINSKTDDLAILDVLGNLDVWGQNRQLRISLASKTE